MKKELDETRLEFLKWLKKNNAIEIDDYNGLPSDYFEYYRHVTAIVDNSVINVVFMKHNGNLRIDYSFKTNRNLILSIEQFLELLK